jgi:dTDP-L-rhamnose 4-epimerase
MAVEKVLITGGAGFIGSWTVDLLLKKGYDVRILDNLQPRVHPRGKPSWVPKEAEFIKGDVANRVDLSQALEGMNYVIHLAAYQDYLPDFSTFIHTNAESSALIFELIVSDPKRYPVRKIVFASSQSVCGEGRYICPVCVREGGQELSISYSDISNRVNKYHNLDQEYVITPPPRLLEQLQKGDWDLHCPSCGGYLEPILIDECAVSPGTAYGISKYAIEMLADRLGRRYGIPTACMRYTYVQGPRNSFYNAYSGIARRFALRLMNNLPPTIYEDGGQLRDYVNVKDVAYANVLVMENPRADYGVFNVGGDRAVTVIEFAKLMLAAFNSDLEPLMSGEYRLGDTRHTISDISRLRALGWEPSIPVEENINEYVAWMREQVGTHEYLEQAERVMREQGVVRTSGAKHHSKKDFSMSNE